jgi:hypothetical protein
MRTDFAPPYLSGHVFAPHHPTPLEGWWWSRSVAPLAPPLLHQGGAGGALPKDCAMTHPSIPSSVLNLLADGGRRFDPNRHPGRYIHRPEDRGARNGLTWSEALALTHDRVVTNDWIGTGAAVALLEHEQHAVVGFCLEVQAAWARCRERLGMRVSSHQELFHA